MGLCKTDLIKWGYKKSCGASCFYG